MDESVCDFCIAAKAVVYCKSDAACLCLQCDRCVHSANALSRKHTRCLIYNKCGAQEATVRCLDDSLSLCDACYRCFGTAEHRHMKLSSDTGCPSDTDFSNIWAWILDWGGPQQELGIGGGNEAGGSVFDGVVVNPLNDIASCLKFGPLPVSSPPPPPPPQFPACMDQTSFSSDNQMPLLSQEASYQKASSPVQQECTEIQPSSANLMPQAMSAGANNLLMNPSIRLGFTGGQVPSSMSLTLSNITGESSAAEYQDCGLSPLFLIDDSPWDSSFDPGCPQARDKAKMRYNEKKRQEHEWFLLFICCYQMLYVIIIFCLFGSRPCFMYTLH